LFLEQLLRTAGDLVDGRLQNSIQSIVLARTDRFAVNERRAIEAASILGQRFTLANLRALIGDERFTGEALLRNALLRPADGLQFVHALVRDGVYASLTRTKRRQLHDLAARVFSAAARRAPRPRRQSRGAAGVSRRVKRPVGPLPSGPSRGPRQPGSRDCRRAARPGRSRSSARRVAAAHRARSRRASRPIAARWTRAGRNRTGDER